VALLCGAYRSIARSTEDCVDSGLGHFDCNFSKLFGATVHPAVIHNQILPFKEAALTQFIEERGVVRGSAYLEGQHPEAIAASRLLR
jgi:hypothetical protein